MINIKIYVTSWHVLALHLTQTLILTQEIKCELSLVLFRCSFVSRTFFAVSISSSHCFSCFLSLSLSTCLCFYLSPFLSLSVSVSISHRLFLHLSLSLSLTVSIYLSLLLSPSLSVAFLSLSVSTFFCRYLFLFSP